MAIIISDQRRLCNHLHISVAIKLQHVTVTATATFLRSFKWSILCITKLGNNYY